MLYICRTPQNVGSNHNFIISSTGKVSLFLSAKLRYLKVSNSFNQAMNTLNIYLENPKHEKGIDYETT
jgi:hypothetical protein